MIYILTISWIVVGIWFCSGYVKSEGKLELGSAIALIVYSPILLLVVLLGEFAKLFEVVIWRKK